MEQYKHTLYKTGRIRQGDIIRNVRFHESFHYEDGLLDLSFIDFPHVLVLTQDCDLEQEFSLKNPEANCVPSSPDRNHEIFVDKALISVLVAPLYNYDQFFDGDHMADCFKHIYPSSYQVKTRPIPRDKTPGKDIRQNVNPRFHFLSLYDQSIIRDSIIDFKHYFSVSLRELKVLRKTNYICTISQLYREKVSHRFVSYLSRIGLPVSKEQNAQVSQSSPI
jgi:hypothetical protein